MPVPTVTLPIRINRLPRGPRSLAGIAWLIGPAIVVFGLAGCGYEKYEQRLEATKQYYAYLGKLDQNLAPEWRRPPLMRLRVPLTMQEIPAAQSTEKTPSESTEEIEKDPRQPDYLDWEIDGLVGAWKGPVEMSGESQAGSGIAYLYAATNQHLFFASDAQRLSGFSANLLSDMEAVFQTSAVADATGDRRLTFPRGNQYSAQQAFDKYILRPEIVINETRYTFEVFTQRQGDNQVVLIYAHPDGVEMRSKMPERILLMLESMKLSNDRPSAPKPGGGAQPGSVSPSSF